MPRGPRKFVPPKQIDEGWAARMRVMLADPLTRDEAAMEIGDWARDLCVVMGAELKTAYFVGAALAISLETSWKEDADDSKSEGE